jgi:hypothetical protein
MKKLQAPTSKHQRNFKYQAPKGSVGRCLVHGAWFFSGAWMLEFGV